MKKHTIKAGKHDYKPGHGLGLRAGKTGFYIQFVISAEAWYDPTEKGPLGTDGADWNKLGGISFFSPFKPKTWKKNSCAAMVAWRPDPIEGWFQVAAYVNDKKGGFEYQTLARVPAGKKCSVSSFRWDGGWLFRFNTPGFKWEAVLPVVELALQVNVGPWFGGNRKSPNDHYITTNLHS